VLKPPTPSPTPEPGVIDDTIHAMFHSPWFWPVAVTIFLLALVISGIPPFHRRGSWRDW
jgi:hypothetical protein